MSKGRGHLTKRCDCEEERWPRCPHSWRVTVSAGRDRRTGQRLQVRETVRGSRRVAEQALARMLRDADLGRVSGQGGRQRLGTYLREVWLPHAATQVRPKTWRRYRELLEGHVIPAAGDIRLARLQTGDLQAALDGMTAAGLAPATVVQARAVIRSALAYAVDMYDLPSNAASRTRPPKVRRPRLTVPDAATLGRILEAARGTSLEGVVTLAIVTGARLGEVIGLRWAQVDLERGQVEVAASLYWPEEGDPVFQPPKGGRTRVVHLPEFAVAWLRHHRRDQAERRLRLGEGWEDHDVVLDRGDGLPLRGDSISSAFRGVAREAGPRGVRLHDLRHAVISELLRQGVSVLVVSRMAGHADPGFTLRVYGHLLEDEGQATARALQDALGGEQ